eukprot:UN06703
MVNKNNNVNSSNSNSNIKRGKPMINPNLIPNRTANRSINVQQGSQNRVNVNRGQQVVQNKPSNQPIQQQNINVSGNYAGIHSQIQRSIDKRNNISNKIRVNSLSSNDPNANQNAKRRSPNIAGIT